jgi:hypothetical protein
MAQVYKILGQSNPTSNTQTTLYTVPAATSTVVSSVIICNLNITDTNYRIALQPAGSSLANTQYIAYDTIVPGSDTIALSLGLTLAATDVVSVFAGTSDVNFSIFGCEIT